MEETPQERIVIGSETSIKVNCSMCQREGTSDQFVTLQDDKGGNAYLCAECKARVDTVLASETQNPNLIFALLVGILGAVIGGLVWYFVAIWTKLEIGYISLALGYLVGFGVYLGAGRKRGHQLQIISAFIAIIAIIVTEKFIVEYFINDYLHKNPSEFPEVPAGQSISVSFFAPGFWKTFISPIGLFIYSIGIYLAYKFCKPRRL